MSQWNDIDKDDMKIDRDEINIYLGYDGEGNNYAVVKIKDILELIKENDVDK